jgi:hypothetical protein
LLSFHSSIQRGAEWQASLAVGGQVSTICLSSIDLRGNRLTGRLLTEIVDTLADLPITKLDLRENEPMSAALVRKVRLAVPHVSIKAKTGVASKRRPHKTKKAVKTEKQGSEPAREMKVEQQTLNVSKVDKTRNQKSHGPSQKTSGPRVVLTPKCYLVGNRAVEFVNFVSELCNVADSLLGKNEQKQAKRS